MQDLVLSLQNENSELNNIIKQQDNKIDALI